MERKEKTTTSFANRTGIQTSPVESAEMARRSAEDSKHDPRLGGEDAAGPAAGTAAFRDFERRPWTPPQLPHRLRARGCLGQRAFARAVASFSPTSQKTDRSQQDRLETHRQAVSIRRVERELQSTLNVRLPRCSAPTGLAAAGR